MLFGGDGNDMLTGGDGDDQMFGEAGNDRMIWNPGDDTDLIEGGDGTDTAEVNGGNGAENFTATANGTRVRFDRVDPAPFSLDIGTTENLVVNMNGGDDSVHGHRQPRRADQHHGRRRRRQRHDPRRQRRRHPARRRRQRLHRRQPGQRHGPARRGRRHVPVGPGDGSDTVEGQDGTDTLLFNGAPPTRASTSRPTAGACGSPATSATSSWTSTTSRRIDLNALGGADTITVNDLRGTDVTQVNVDLAGTIGGTAATAQADTVIVNGTSGGRYHRRRRARDVRFASSGWRPQ